MNITGINPLIEALQSNISINQIYISQNIRNPKVIKIKELCKSRSIIYKFVPQAAIDRKAGKDNQGVFAQVSPVNFLTLNQLIKTDKNGLIVILANISDPHNLGAIIRSSVCAGVGGILISQKNSSPINETVLKVSAGTLLKAGIVHSKNVSNDVNILKKNGYWIIGADMRNSIEYGKFDYSDKTALVLGNEQKGISPNLKKLIDQFVHIPIATNTDSLNVSVAGGIILFEAARQKGLFHNG
jgi:23S rRNA (guanosine2251-2'-O)-methyltransferase